MKIYHIRGQFLVANDDVIEAALAGITHKTKKDNGKYRISMIPTIIAVNKDKLVEQEWRPDQPIDPAEIVAAEADDTQTVFPPPPPPDPIEAKYYIERMTPAELNELFDQWVQKKILTQERADEIRADADIV